MGKLVAQEQNLAMAEVLARGAAHPAKTSSDEGLLLFVAGIGRHSRRYRPWRSSLLKQEASVEQSFLTIDSEAMKADAG